MSGMKAATMASRRVEFSMTMFWDNVRLAWLLRRQLLSVMDLKWKVPTYGYTIYIFTLSYLSFSEFSHYFLVSMRFV